MVVSFDDEVRVLSPLTSDRKSLERAIKSAKIGDIGGTALRDAVAQVTEQDLKGLNGRKAIVLLTDGKDSGSRISERRLFEEAAESGAMIYPVFFDSASDRRLQDFGGDPRWERSGRRGRNRLPPPPRQRDERRRERAERTNVVAMDFLNKLAEASAGRAYRSEVTDLKKTFRLIAEELRHQYRLGFYPDKGKLDGTKHAIQVQVSSPDAIVRARRNYTAVRADQP